MNHILFKRISTILIIVLGVTSCERTEIGENDQFKSEVIHKQNVKSPKMIYDDEKKSIDKDRVLEGKRKK